MSTMWSSVKSFSNALISSAAVERLFSSLLPSKLSLIHICFSVAIKKVEFEGEDVWNGSAPLLFDAIPALSLIHILPISVIIIDFFHWPNQGVWDFDKKYWPDPAAMVRELEEMGIRLFVSVWPTVDPRSPYYAEMLEKGYICLLYTSFPVCSRTRRLM